MCSPSTVLVPDDTGHCICPPGTHANVQGTVACHSLGASGLGGGCGRRAVGARVGGPPAAVHPPPPPPPPAPPLCLQYATPHCVQHKVTTASPLPEVLFFLGSCIALALLLPSTLIPFTLIVITMTIWILQV